MFEISKDCKDIENRKSKFGHELNCFIKDNMILKCFSHSKIAVNYQLNWKMGLKLSILLIISTSPSSSLVLNGQWTLHIST